MKIIYIYVAGVRAWGVLVLKLRFMLFGSELLIILHLLKPRNKGDTVEHDFAWIPTVFLKENKIIYSTDDWKMFRKPSNRKALF